MGSKIIFNAGFGGLVITDSLLRKYERTRCMTCLFTTNGPNNALFCLTSSRRNAKLDQRIYYSYLFQATPKIDIFSARTEGSLCQRPTAISEIAVDPPDNWYARRRSIR
jgi:hypothetical protein